MNMSFSPLFALLFIRCPSLQWNQTSYWKPYTCMSIDLTHLVRDKSHSKAALFPVKTHKNITNLKLPRRREEAESLRLFLEDVLSENGEGSSKSLGPFEEMKTRPVVLKFSYALADVVEGPVHCLLLEWRQVGVPSLHQLKDSNDEMADLLDGGDVNDAVVEMVFELRHVLLEEAAIHVHCVSAQWTRALQRMLLHEVQRLNRTSV